MGVRGAGLATVVSQLIAGAYIVSLFLRGKTTTPFVWHRRGIGFNAVKRIAAVGFPQAAGQLSLSVGYFFFNRILLSIDPQAVAAFAVYTRFEQIILMPILAIGTAVITMVGQSFGAGRLLRIIEVWRKALLLALLLVCAIVALLIAGSPRIYPLFSDVPEVTRYAVRQTIVIAPSYLMVAIVVLVRTLFQGLGKPLPGVVGNVLRSIGIAVPAALLFTTLGLGVPGVWYGIMTANVLTAVVSLVLIARALGRLRTQDMKA
jgi:Na+-driven multidrug efflux pump